MTCRDVLTFLSDYLTGELPSDARELFERHLTACSSCLAYLDSYEKTIALAQAVADGEPPRPPRELEEAILGSLRKERME